MKKYRYHQDPGHGWIQVTLDELKQAGVLHSITPYSYIDLRNEIAYLEEDCDAATFVNAAGITRDQIEDVYHRGDCYIRRLPHFRVPSMGDNNYLES